MIRVVVIATGKHFTAVTGWIEEVDSLPVSQAVTGGANINSSIRHGNQIRRFQDVVPGFQIERGVVQFARFRVLNESNVVRFHADAHKGRQTSITVHHLLRQIKAEYIAEQLHGAVDVRAVQQAVVKTRGLHAFQFARPGFRVHIAANTPLASLFFGGENLEQVSGWRIETHTTTAAFQLIGWNVFHLATIIDQAMTQGINSVFGHTLVADEIHTGAIGFTQNHREFVDLGPAFQIHTALFIAVDLNQAQQIAVVSQCFFHIQYAQLDVSWSHYTVFHNEVLFFYLSLLERVKDRAIRFYSGLDAPDSPAVPAGKPISGGSGISCISLRANTRQASTSPCSSSPGLMCALLMGLETYSPCSKRTRQRPQPPPRQPTSITD